MNGETSLGWPTLWPALLTLTQLLLALCATGHVVLGKRDVSAAIGWVGLVWLVPFAGPILYLFFGINRIRRRAAGLKRPRAGARPLQPGAPAASRLAAALPEADRHLAQITRLLDSITEAPLTEGNRFEALVSGEDAYDAMLAAIDAARSSVGLVTYIFDNDQVGRRFVRALEAAHRRGVAVRVLVDGVGARYTRPPVPALLARLDVAAAEFLPTRFPFRLPYANLRNHRKILVVDGGIGFTGGMNIRAGHVARDGDSAIADVHFRIAGPVVDHLTATFIDDWAFATGETLGEHWFQPEAGDAAPAGDVPARGIAAGPDESFERIRWTMLAALALAEREVRIVTPYFLPDPTLADALALAAMRGVVVDILLPERGNLRLVQWASRAKLGDLIGRGCRVWLVPPPFEHAKLMTVDGAWVLVGSANWDQRSLRLNFEFNVEAYGRRTAAMLDALIEARRASARRLGLADTGGRPLLLRLRDSAAWLASPYL
jgi:cardiolipin synthase